MAPLYNSGSVCHCRCRRFKKVISNCLWVIANFLRDFHGSDIFARQIQIELKKKQVELFKK